MPRQTGPLPLLFLLPVFHMLDFSGQLGINDGVGVLDDFLFDWNEEYFAGPFVSDMNGIQRALEEIADGRDEYIADVYKRQI